MKKLLVCWLYVSMCSGADIIAKWDKSVWREYKEGSYRIGSYLKNGGKLPSVPYTARAN